VVKYWCRATADSVGIYSGTKNDCVAVLFAENLSASKIVSIKDLRDMLQKSPDAVAQQDAETTQQAGRETTQHAGHEPTQQARDHGSAKQIPQSTTGYFSPVPPAVHIPFSSMARPSQVTTSTSLTTRAAAPNVEGPRPAGTLASLLQSSQAAEAKAYFTGLLPGKSPPPRPMSVNSPKPPAASSSKAASVPSFTGFTGKLGSATNGSVKFDFSAVRVSRISSLVCHAHAFVAENCKLALAEWWQCYVAGKVTTGLACTPWSKKNEVACVCFGPWCTSQLMINYCQTEHGWIFWFGV